MRRNLTGLTLNIPLQINSQNHIFLLFYSPGVKGHINVTTSFCKLVNPKVNMILIKYNRDSKTVAFFFCPDSLTGVNITCRRERLGGQVGDRSGYCPAISYAYLGIYKYYFTTPSWDINTTLLYSFGYSLSCTTPSYQNRITVHY